MRVAVILTGLLSLWTFAPDEAVADSVAARNKEGNRLFQKGQFQEAEKAYIDAQLEDPGRPELLYNLGNAMVRQKKLDKAVQSLRQAVSKGDRGLQANGWYNLGNSLFESKNYKDSAQAYIQSLRINPADRDAKHNLELAWRKMQEQKEKSSGKDNKDDSQNSDSNKDQRQGQDKPEKQDQSKPQGSQDSKSSEKPPPSQAERKEGSMSKERAMQILDAMKNQELMDQRKLTERLAKRKAGGRDW